MSEQEKQGADEPAGGAREPRAPDEPPPGRAASLGDSALLIVAMAGITYFMGAKYYEGYFGHFRLTSHLNEVPSDRYLSESLHVGWQFLVAVALLILVQAAAGRAREPLRAFRFYGAAWLWCGGIGLWTVLWRLRYTSPGNHQGVMLMSAALLAIGYLVVTCPACTRGLWRRVQGVEPHLAVILVLLVLATPFLLLAKPRGVSLAKRAISGTEPFSHLVPRSDLGGAAPKDGSNTYYVVLHEDGWLHLVAVADPPPDRSVVHRVRADGVSAYRLFPSRADLPED